MLYHHAVLRVRYSGADRELVRTGKRLVEVRMKDSRRHILAKQHSKKHNTKYYADHSRTGKKLFPSPLKVQRLAAASLNASNNNSSHTANRDQLPIPSADIVCEEIESYYG